ncbi:transcriptional regulator [Clostridia bacterium]|nr:transcriptional regulator [Clostridia bacterium]
MKVRYNRLFKLLIDKQMRKGELCKAANISTAVIGKLAQGQNVTVDMLVRICGVLNCTMDDIMELIPDDKAKTNGDDSQ